MDDVLDVISKGWLYARCDAQCIGHRAGRRCAPAARAAAPALTRLDAASARSTAPSRPSASSGRLRRPWGPAAQSAATPGRGCAARSLRARSSWAVPPGWTPCPRPLRVRPALRAGLPGVAALRVAGGALPPIGLTAAGAACSPVGSLRPTAPPGRFRSRWGASRNRGCGWTPCPGSSASPCRRPLPLAGPGRASTLLSPAESKPSIQEPRGAAIAGKFCSPISPKSLVHFNIAVTQMRHIGQHHRSHGYYTQRGDEAISEASLEMVESNVMTDQITVDLYKSLSIIWPAAQCQERMCKVFLPALRAVCFAQLRWLKRRACQPRMPARQPFLRAGFWEDTKRT